MSTPIIKQKISRHARLMQSAAARLEQNRTLFALSMPEYRAARELVNAAVEYVNEYIFLHPRSKKLPRVFKWCDARYRLEYTTLGRVRVRVIGSKARFNSEVFAI